MHVGPSICSTTLHPIVFTLGCAVRVRAVRVQCEVVWVIGSRKAASSSHYLRPCNLSISNRHTTSMHKIHSSRCAMSNNQIKIKSTLFIQHVSYNNAAHNNASQNKIKTAQTIKKKEQEYTVMNRNLQDKNYLIKTIQKINRNHNIIHIKAQNNIHW